MLRKAVTTILFIIIVAAISVNVTPYVRQLLLQSGAIQEEVLIAGTGSMYPTFPKGNGKTDVVRAQETVAWPKMRIYPSGINIFGFHFFSYKLQHGDIVEFENKKTDQISKEKYGDTAGFVKRIIALPGDTIDLRDGFVYLNGERIDEPYTAKPRSTYGGNFLADCTNLKIPVGSVFVMGDNRKASLDSRYELGLVDISDIHFVLPWDDQETYHKLWRDTENDALLANTPTLDASEFIKLLDEKRQTANGTSPLRYNVLLTNSSKIRGDAMINTDDFSTEATRSGMTLAKSIKESGYENIIFAEVYTRGYYDAQELVDNFLEFPDTKKILFSAEYQDIGISPVLGEINSCPSQVIVVHLGGYVPPSYTQKEIGSWQSLIENIEKVLPSWESAKGAEGISQSKLDQLLNILNTRLSNAKIIYARMQADQWLTDAQKKMVSDDPQLAAQANDLIDQLNKR
ncbi:signal peptidase I [Patescibacteria group bacterium]|nr:signal peptidase I [Patescibacteria group bacterium]